MYTIQNKKTRKSPLDLFLLSVVLFQVGTIIRVQLGIQTAGNVLRIIGIAILLYSILRQIASRKSMPLDGIMVFLLAWNTINIIYTTISSGINLTRTFSEDGYILNYILPYMLLYNVQSLDIKKAFKYSIVFAIISLFVVLFNFNYILGANNLNMITGALEDESMSMYFAQLPIMWSIPSALIFMNTPFVKNKHIVIAMLTVLLATMFSMAFGRRGTSLYGFAFLAVGAYMYLNDPYISIKSKRRLKFLIAISIIIAIAMAGHFSFLIERGTIDSRSGIDDAFYADMNTIDYIFGRGLNGTYYDPLIIFEDFNFQRRGLETGYLNIILHAGLLYLIPYLILCFKSAYLGFFKSRNTFVKSFAIYIFINTLMLPLGSYPVFNLRFFMLWIGIMLCNNYHIRNMDNNEIKSLYKLGTI